MVQDTSGEQHVPAVLNMKEYKQTHREKREKNDDKKKKKSEKQRSEVNSPQWKKKKGEDNTKKKWITHSPLGQGYQGSAGTTRGVFPLRRSERNR